MSRRPLVTLTAVSLLALAACSDSTAPSAGLSDAEVSADVAVAAGQAAVSTIGVVRGDMARAGLPGSAASDAGQVGSVSEHCTWEDATTSWFCALTTENGISVERRISIFADNVAGAQYNPTTTDSIRVHTEASGSFTREQATLDVSSVHDVTVSGLEGAEVSRTVSGTSTREETAEFTGRRGTRHYEAVVTGGLEAVVFPVGGGYPLSGRLTHGVQAVMTFTGAREETRQVSRQVTITFNGTAMVPVTVGSLSCTLNLDTGRVSCAQ